MALAGSNRKPALTAAASKIGYSQAAAGKLKETPEQDRAWQVYEVEGSIYFMTRYRSAVARKLDYYVATVDSPGDDPNIDAVYDDEGSLVSLGAGAKVLEVEGGPELLRRLVSELMVHWDVPGEGYLVRFDVDPLWRVLSTQELKKQKNTASYAWGDDTFQQGSIDSDGVFRVWKPHPRFHWKADSPTMHILEDAEELVRLRREMQARSNSRLPAGVLLFPDSIDLSPFAEDEAGTEDDIARWLTEVMSQAVSDPGSTRALTPVIMTMAGQDIDKVRWLRFEREWDINLEQRSSLLRSIATGLDVPPEILTGMADLNHWSAWLVSEQAVSQHVAPTVDDILDSLTINWFRPLLQAGSVDPDGYVLWRDLSPATVGPDQSDTAIELKKLNVISDAATRRVANFDEEDAPEQVEGESVMDADELIKRINALGVLRRAGADWESANRAVGLPPIELIPGLLPITVRAEELIQNEAPVVAAMPGVKVLAEEPARIDSDLLNWLIEAAHVEIERLVAFAEDQALTAGYDQTITAAADPMHEGLLGKFAERVDRRISQAQSKVRSWLSRIVGADVTIDGQDAARAAGVAAIVKAVLDHVRARLFTPDPSPDPIDLGEIPDVAVPVKALRDGLSVAGGGLPLFEGEKAWELVGNGKDTLDVLQARGFRSLSYRWEYGLAPRAVEFPPHRALDQSEFDSWESPTLNVASEDSWLRRPFYRVGDHAGCLCSYTRILTLSLNLPVAAAV